MLASRLFLTLFLLFFILAACRQGDPRPRPLDPRDAVQTRNAIETQNWRYVEGEYTKTALALSPVATASPIDSLDLTATAEWQITNAAEKLAIVYQSQTAAAFTPSLTPTATLTPSATTAPQDAARAIFDADMTLTATFASSPSNTPNPRPRNTISASPNLTMTIEAYRTEWIRQTEAVQQGQILSPIPLSPIPLATASPSPEED